MSDELDITKFDLIRLADEMVNYSGLTHLYGMEPFLKSKKAFAEALDKFDKTQPKKKTPPPIEYKICEPPIQIPEFLK